MKKTTLFISSIICALLFSTNVFAQVLFEENFDYPVGDTLTNHGIWTNHSGSGFLIMVNSGSLSYVGYPASGIGNSTSLLSGPTSREDVHAPFGATDTTGSVYTAFLIKVDSASTTGEYFFHLWDDAATFNFRGRTFARDDGAGNLNIGLRKASSGTINWSGALNFSETYLLVLKYEYVGDLASSDDSVKLYINPDISSPEPASADLVNLDTNTDINVAIVALRQGSNMVAVQIDGIRVTTLWGNIVPVELTSFTASVSGNSVTLNWATATELNNSGFEVQRSATENTWEKIAFVKGFGSTTETKNYSFLDNNLAAGQYSYRLKQIDYDGTSELSDVVNVEVINPVQYALSQNYPNPFNPSTTINFTLPEASNVTLKIFNTLGEEVSVLVNRVMEAGTHNVNFE
jgi:hypothetical protein